MAPSGAAMSETPESGCRAGERQSQIGGHERSAGGDDRAHPVFHPSNGTFRVLGGVASPLRYRCGQSAASGVYLGNSPHLSPNGSLARDQAMSPSTPSSPRPRLVRAGRTKGGPRDFHWPNSLRCALKAARERKPRRDAQSATSALTDYTPAHTSPMDVVDPQPDLVIHEQRPLGHTGRHGQAIPAHIVIIGQPVDPLPCESCAVRWIIGMPHRAEFRRRAPRSTQSASGSTCASNFLHVSALLTAHVL